MKWSHLPVGGGIYDQDPELMDGFLVIFSERAAHESEEAAKRERDQKNPRNKGSSRPSGSRRKRS